MIDIHAAGMIITHCFYGFIVLVNMHPPTASKFSMRIKTFGGWVIVLALWLYTYGLWLPPTIFSHPR